MTPGQQVAQRTQEIAELHRAFYDFYVAELRRDASAYSKYRLQLSTVYFETYLEQTKATYPLLARAALNQDEKKSVARAALFDALVAHTFGAHQDAVTTYLSNRIADLEEKVNGVSKGKQAVAGPKSGKQK